MKHQQNIDIPKGYKARVELIDGVFGQYINISIVPINEEPKKKTLLSRLQNIAYGKKGQSS